MHTPTLLWFSFIGCVGETGLQSEFIHVPLRWPLACPQCASASSVWGSLPPAGEGGWLPGDALLSPQGERKVTFVITGLRGVLGSLCGSQLPYL